MKALFPQIDYNTSKPYYLQLYEYMKDQIISGELLKDERLPSLRAFAKSTGLSITTIEQCYNQLLVEGYIYSKPQSGYFVSHVSMGEKHQDKTVSLKQEVFDYELLSESNSFDISVPSMQYDPDCFNFNKWKKCMNKILTDYSFSLHFGGAPQGEESLRIEIAKYLYLSRGVACNPDQIVIGAGTQQITNQLATLLRKMKIEHVALETPGYQPVRNSFRDRGFAITSVPIDENGIILDRLPTNIRTSVYVSPSNNTFTGAVMPIGRRYELINWAEHNNSYIIEDDYDSELRYFGKPIPALCSLNHNDKVIYLGSFSSTLFSAIKISYMVLPVPMAKLFKEIAGDYSQTCSKLEQLTLAMFMDTGYYQTHIKKLRKLYSQKLTQVTSAFNHYGSDFIEVNNTSSGINMILRINTSKAQTQLIEEARDLGLTATTTVPDRTPRQSILFYYNHIPLDGIESAIEQLVVKWRGEPSNLPER